jgi:hypothetical protein
LYITDSPDLFIKVEEIINFTACENEGQVLNSQVDNNLAQTSKEPN